MSKAVKILIVDDDPADLLVIGRLLRESSRGEFAPLQAASLDEAALTLRVSSVSLIVVDLNLVETQGVQTVVTAREKFPTVPIVALTTTESDGLGEACIDMGADDFLAKSRLKSDLERAVKFALNRRELFSRRAKAVFDTFISELSDSGSNGARIRELVERHRELITEAAVDPQRRSFAIRKARAVAERLVDLGADPAEIFREVVDMEPRTDALTQAFVSTLAVNLAVVSYARAADSRQR